MIEPRYVWQPRDRPNTGSWIIQLGRKTAEATGIARKRPNHQDFPVKQQSRRVLRGRRNHGAGSGPSGLSEDRSYDSRQTG